MALLVWALTHFIGDSIFPICVLGVIGFKIIACIVLIFVEDDVNVPYIISCIIGLICAGLLITAFDFPEFPFYAVMVVLSIIDTILGIIFGNWGSLGGLFSNVTALILYYIV